MQPIVDEVFFQDGDHLVDVAVDHNTTYLHETLTAVISAINKNARSQNQVEEMVSNLKMYVEANVGKLNRMANVTDDGTRILKDQMSRMQEEISQLREAACRKEDIRFEVDKVRADIRPFQNYLETLDTFHSPMFEKYVMHIMNNEVPKKFTNPLQRSFEERIQKQAELFRQKTEEEIGSRVKVLESLQRDSMERWTSELNGLKAWSQKWESEREIAKTEADAALNEVMLQTEARLTQTAAEWDDSLFRTQTQLQLLEERHRRLIDVFGLRENVPSSPRSPRSSSEEHGKSKGKKRKAKREVSDVPMESSIVSFVAAETTATAEQSKPSEDSRASPSPSTESNTLSVETQGDGSKPSRTVQLLPRGKSVVKMNDPIQKTGIFSMQVFQTLLEYVHSDTLYLLEDLEHRMTTALEQLQEGLLQLLESRGESSAEDVLVLSGSSQQKTPTHLPGQAHHQPGNAALRNEVQGLQKSVATLEQQVEQLKKRKVDQAAMQAALAPKVDRQMHDLKADKKILDTVTGQLDLRLSELHASVVQLQTVTRTLDERLIQQRAVAAVDVPPYSLHNMTHDERDEFAGSGSDLGFTLPTGAHAPPRRLQIQASSLRQLTSGGGVSPATSTMLPPSSHTTSAHGLPSSSARPSPTPSPAGFIRPATGQRPPTAIAAIGTIPTAAMQETTISQQRRKVQATSDDTTSRPSTAAAAMLPSLKEAMFHMSDDVFNSHRSRCEKEGRPVVVPRPPSSQ